MDDFAFNLNGKFKYHGMIPSDKMKDFLSDKSFIISSSVKEGCPMNILEGMAMGLKPLVHVWPGALDIFPRKWVWASIKEATDILESEHNPEEYRQFVVDNHNPKIADKIAEVVCSAK
jgi:glycosyltransferase involved in cell wall biosynthesis